MAGNELSEEQKLAELRTGELIDKEVKDTNKEEPKVETTATTETEKKEEVKITETTQTTEKPYWEQKGFTSQVDMDAFIENNRVPKKNTYTSKQAEELDNFAAATGKDDLVAFNFYKTTEIKESMDPKDLVALLVEKEILDNPALAKFKDMRREELEKEYLLDMDEKAEGITQKDLYQKEMKNVQLKKDADVVINDIKTVREKLQNSGLSEAEIKDQADKLNATKTKLSDWSTKVSKELELNIPDFKKNDKGEIEFLTQKNDKGEEQPVIIKNFTFGEEEKTFFKTSLDGVIAQMGYPEPDSDSAKLALNIARMATVDMFLPNMVKEVIAQTEANMIKKYNIDADNPSIKKEAALAENLDGVLSEEEAVKKARGGG